MPGTKYDENNSDHKAIKKAYNKYTHRDSRSKAQLEAWIHSWTHSTSERQQQIAIGHRDGREAGIGKWFKKNVELGAHGTEEDAEGEDE